MVGLMQTRMYSLACATVFLPAVCYAGRNYLLHFLLFSVLPFPSRANNYALKYLRYFSAVFLFCLPTLLFYLISICPRPVWCAGITYAYSIVYIYT